MIKARQHMFVPALAICVLATWWFTDSWIVAVPGVLGIISIAWKRRGIVDTIGQLIAALLGLVIVYAVFFLWQQPDRVTGGQLSVVREMGAVYVVGLVSLRMWLQAPLGGNVVTAFILFLCWLFLGLTTEGVVYLLFCVPGVLAILAGAREQRTYSSHKKKSQSRIWPWLMRSFILVTAAAIATVFIAAIPVAYHRLEARFLDSLTRRATGFSVVLELGPVNDMFVSDHIVMRAFGARQQNRYWRGQVYNSYSGRYWTSTLSPRSVSSPFESLDASGVTVKVRLTSSDDRLFVPLRFAGVSTADSGVTLQVNELGLVSTRENEEVENYNIQIASSQNARRVLPPQQDDAAVPESLQDPLKQWMNNHVEQHLNPAQRLAAIQLALQNEYTYALSFSRAPHADAILDFLYRNKQGHCEYFASAFTLLARTAGIPARVVSGYVLKEYNSVGEYYVVRDRHAHAWTEVWLNGRWQPMDPTPSAGAVETQSALMEVLDFSWVWLSSLKDRLLGMNRYVIVALIVLLLAVWGVIIFRRRIKNAAPKNSALEYGVAHAMLLEIESMLADKLPRSASEPIEDWARRLLQHDTVLQPMAVLLEDYAAWRYGGVGSIEAIQQQYKDIMHKPQVIC